MPVFDYKCPTCGTVTDAFVHKHDDLVQCPECLVSMVKIYTSFPQVHLFPNGGITLKNLPGGPKTFSSQGEMRRYANKHNLELGALL